MTLELWSAVIGDDQEFFLRLLMTFLTGFVPPYALQRILTALQEGTPESRKDAFFYAFIAFIANLSFAQVDLFQGWHTRRCYERTRGQVGAFGVRVTWAEH